MGGKTGGRGGSRAGGRAGGHISIQAEARRWGLVKLSFLDPVSTPSLHFHLETHPSPHRTAPLPVHRQHAEHCLRWTCDPGLCLAYPPPPTHTTRTSTVVCRNLSSILTHTHTRLQAVAGQTAAQRPISGTFNPGIHPTCPPASNQNKKREQAEVSSHRGEVVFE